MTTSIPCRFDYEVGDLVILLHSVEFQGNYAAAGEVGLIIKVFLKLNHNIYDCKIKLKCGGELDCWFGEIHKLVED